MAMKRLVISLCMLVVLSVIVAIPPFTAYAEDLTLKTPLSMGSLNKINDYLSTQSIFYSDGTIIERSIINGPPKPPPGHVRPTVSLPEPMPEMGTNTLTDVPAFTWVFGCSAVSAAMIAGYYDRNGFSDIYTGPTSGSVIPLTEDSSWGTWTDSVGDHYPNNPLVASHQGLDSRTAFGSIDDYWVSYLSNASDPYITGNWAQHTWGDAIGDYMKTSQYSYGNVDGSTSFYLNNSATPLYCDVMESSGIADEDGTYGRKLFYEARGYKVTDCYTQVTDNKRRGGFSFAQYKAEIDAGRPVLLNLQGHSVVGVGYDDSSRTVYIHDTWDNSDHAMPWGGKYAGMVLWGVSIVNIQQSTLLPDLSGYWSSVSKTNQKGNYTVSAIFTTTNTGSVKADNVIVNFSFPGVVIDPVTFSSISAGSSQATTIQFTTSRNPKGKTLVAVVDPSKSITESNESNNTISVTIP
jgi:YD repeat-containing protein